jgi:hypothetical protein
MKSTAPKHQIQRPLYLNVTHASVTIVPKKNDVSYPYGRCRAQKPIETMISPAMRCCAPYVIEDKLGVDCYSQVVQSLGEARHGL